MCGVCSWWISYRRNVGHKHVQMKVRLKEICCSLNSLFTRPPSVHEEGFCMSLQGTEICEWQTASVEYDVKFVKQEVHNVKYATRCILTGCRRRTAESHETDSFCLQLHLLSATFYRITACWHCHFAALLRLRRERLAFLQRLASQTGGHRTLALCVFWLLHTMIGLRRALWRRLAQSAEWWWIRLVTVVI